MKNSVEFWLLGLSYGVICLAAGTTGFLYGGGETGFGSGPRAAAPFAFLGAMVVPFMTAILVSELSGKTRLAIVVGIAIFWVIAALLCFYFV